MFGIPFLRVAVDDSRGSVPSLLSDSVFSMAKPSACSRH
jgi:hypothetical protein